MGYQALASVALAIFPSPASLIDLVEFAPNDEAFYYAAQGAITGAVWGAISGGTLGVFQALVLWRAVRGAGAWPVICVVGGLTGAAVTSAHTWGATGDPPLSEKVMGLVTGLDALNAAITAGVVGLGLVKLLERQAAMERRLSAELEQASQD